MTRPFGFGTLIRQVDGIVEFKCALTEIIKGLSVNTFRGHTNFVFSVSFNNASNLLVSGGSDETVRIWDVARGDLDFCQFPGY